MPAVTPPYRPIYGVGAPNGSAVQGAIYFDTANNYAPYTFNNGAWNAFAPILLGAGVPAFIAKAGTLYSRTDAAGVYASTPTLAAAAVVQNAHTSGHGAPSHAVMGAAITAGNLLLNFLGSSNGMEANVDLSKWTILDAGNQFSIDALVAYRYADGTEGTTPPNLCTAGNPFWGLTCVEISGVTGNINTDLHLHHFDAGGNNFNTTTPLSTTSTNQLSMLCEFAYDSTANFIALGGAWGVVSSWNDGAANYGAMAISDQVPASGTNVGNVNVVLPAGNSGVGYAETLIFNPGLVAGWTLIGP